MKKLVLLATLSFTTIAGAQEYPQTGRIGPAYIGGMEYWPFDDAIPGSPYPDRVLWSYGEGSDLAKKCMLQGNQLLVSWLKDDNHPVTKALKEYKEIGGTADFFMWTNDYSKAPAQAARGMRKSHVWWWSGSGSDTSGWLKFESTVSPDGTCSNPKPEQIVSYLESRYSLFAAAPSENIQDSNRQEIAEPGFLNRIQNFFNSSGSAR
ncbi:MAG: hypothetical protein CME71_12530 [Halobacteriovorax sp.]|nr:hypothetical protein [Halobacteriovorax sp.]|tara:strand:- start:424 stop:1044 length:621 start_codon:yes stop_codon:yes gene_type:complete